MTGYQEVVTDPSFAEQLVCFTAPMVGNYGVAEARSESARPHARAVADARGARARRGRTGCTSAASSRSAGSTPARSCCKLRDAGAMRAVAVAGDGSVDEARRVARAQPSMAGRALVARRLDARAVRLLRARAVRGSPSSTTAASARSSAGSPVRARP